MVIQAKHEHREQMRGGKGSAEMYHVLEKDPSSDTVRLFCKIVLNPLSSIGRHQHVGETEPYYILSGEGLFSDNDGSLIPVKAGDVCLIESGDTHGIENTSATEELSLMAVIYKKD